MNDNQVMTTQYRQFEVPELFRDTLSPDQVDEYVEAARRHYSDEMPYHNWGHALDVIGGVESIADKLEAKGVYIDRGAMAVAAAWHDAGYYESHTKKGFSTKERYSAALLSDFLEGKPVNERVKRTLMLNPIIATVHEHPENRLPAELILHRADIANIGGPTEGFMESSIKLWREGGFTDWGRHVRMSEHFIDFCIVEHERESRARLMDPGDFTVDVYDEPFADAATRNLEALREMTEEPDVPSF